MHKLKESFPPTGLCLEYKQPGRGRRGQLVPIEPGHMDHWGGGHFYYLLFFSASSRFPALLSGVLSGEHSVGQSRGGFAPVCSSALPGSPASTPVGDSSLRVAMVTSRRFSVTVAVPSRATSYAGSLDRSTPRRTPRESVRLGRISLVI